MRSLALTLSFVLLLLAPAFAQVPVNTGVQILKAEDARRYDAVLENLLKSPNASIRTRAALAAGRIGDEKAVPALSALLSSSWFGIDQEMAAFASRRDRIDHCCRSDPQGP